jgi:hypothetical protein
MTPFLVQSLPYAVIAIVIVIVIPGNSSHNCRLSELAKRTQQPTIHAALDGLKLKVAPSIATFEFTEELQKNTIPNSVLTSKLTK